MASWSAVVVEHAVRSLATTTAFSVNVKLQKKLLIVQVTPTYSLLG